ncbi:MAG: hypothetical protein JWM87_731 [Candidatus Eremiobacteraeota bacterium]|nr:hypothetical protein [Candidatus Eremiobacteraeota bacterium]
MEMVTQFITKAAYDTSVGANAMRQDLSDVITALETRERPVSQGAPQIDVGNTTHQWLEQGRNGVAGNGGSPVASYAEAATPNTAAKAPVKPSNKVAHVGLTAQVSDTVAATWTRGGAFTLQLGDEVKLLTEAMDEQIELASLDCLDFIECLHVSGDSASGAFAGGQPDGMIKWITAGGTVVVTGGTSGTPVNMALSFIQKGARQALESHAPAVDTILVPPELIYDINSYVGNGASRPITVIAGSGPNGLGNLVAGNGTVGWVNTGHGLAEVKVEPDLSPLFNPLISQCHVIMYAKRLVKHGNLIKFGSVPLAKTGTSVQVMVNNVFTQEYRIPKHAILIPNVQSAF